MRGQIQKTLKEYVRRLEDEEGDIYTRTDIWKNATISKDLNKCRYFDANDIEGVQRKTRCFCGDD